MGYDMYTLEEEEYFRANIWSMSLLRGAMETANVLDLNHPQPEWSEVSEEEQELNPEAWSKANANHLTFQSVHFNKVPVGKFCSNDGWHVTPNECFIIANGLDEILNSTNPIYYREYDWKSRQYLTQECQPGEEEYIAEFRDYCRKAASQGGFKVW